MRIEAPARVRRPLPLVPLVDVVFLLLMFFMLSSTFSKFGNLQLAGASRSPATSSNPDARASSVPGVIVSVSRGPRIKINGIEGALDDLVSRLNEAQVNGARSAAVVLTASAEVQDLVIVLERARTSKLAAITVMR
jgi:biopolymer transport protein ExbD